MSIWGFVIGTGIIWLLSALFVEPLARALTRRSKGLQSALDGESGTALTSESATEEISLGSFILADVMVLALAGLLLGLVLGWVFIGITWHARNWPGLIGFIVASIIGSAIHG